MATIFNQQQLERAHEFVQRTTSATRPWQAPGLAGAKHKWAMFLAGIPDLRVTIEKLVQKPTTWQGAGPMRASTRESCWASRLPASRSVSAASALSGSREARLPSSESS